MKFIFLRTISTILCFTALLLVARTANAQYCIPAPTMGCTTGDYPGQFALTGTTSSINDPSLTCTGGIISSTSSFSYSYGGYQDLTAETCAVVSPSVDNGTITGSSYYISSFTSTSYYPYYTFTYYAATENMEIYVDFNNDDIFEASESIGGLNPVSTTSASPFSVTIPSGIAAGFYRMRLVFTSTNNGVYTAGGGSYIDPCLLTAGVFPYNTGEAIDYTLEVGTMASCGVPTLSPVTGITSTSGILNWTEPTGSVGSEYVISTTSGTPTGSGTQTTALTQSFTGLTPSTVYYVYVRDSCGPGNFSAWVTETFTTNPTAVCAPPTGLGASGITSTTATLNWTEPGGSVGSEYVVTTTPGTPPGSGTPTTGLTYTATGLTPGTVYYASVRDSCGPGDFSAWVTITFTTNPCGVPTGLGASGITSTGATLTWTEPGGSAGSEYVISTTPGAPTGSGTITTASSFTATGLTPSTTYYVYVRDSCGPGDFSAWVPITFMTLAPPCNPPTGLTASGITSSNATISWTEPGGSTGSEYVLTTIPGTPTGSGVQTTGLSFTITTLTGSTVYYVYVRDSCGPGDFSAWVTLTFTTTPTPPGPCDVPVGLMASGVTNSSAVLTWIEPSGSVGSEYAVSTSSSAPTGSGIQTTASTFTATGLALGTEYYAYVRDSCGAGDFSDWVSIVFWTSPTITGINNVGSNDFTINTFPNPVKELLTIKIDGTIGGVGQIELMDITGKLIKTVPVNANTLTVGMDGLPSGIYLIRYTDAIRTKTIKITTAQ